MLEEWLALEEAKELLLGARLELELLVVSLLDELSKLEDCAIDEELSSKEELLSSSMEDEEKAASCHDNAYNVHAYFHRLRA